MKRLVLTSTLAALSLTGCELFDFKTFCDDASPCADGSYCSAEGFCVDGDAPDDGGTPPGDSGTPPVDSGTPPVDSGAPPVDSGAPPTDSGTPPGDGGTPLGDAGQAVDAGPLLPAPVISISPASPSSSDDVTVSIDTPSAGAASHTIRWFRLTAEQMNLRDEDTLPASRTTKGQSWRVEVRGVEAGGREGLPASRMFTVANGAPFVRSVAIYPRRPLAGGWLRAFPVGEDDPDASDNVDVTIRWLDDQGMPIGTGEWLNTTGRQGEIVFAELTPNDGTTDGEVVLSCARPIGPRDPNWDVLYPGGLWGDIGDLPVMDVLSVDEAGDRLIIDPGMTAIARAPGWEYSLGREPAWGAFHGTGVAQDAPHLAAEVVDPVARRLLRFAGFGEGGFGDEVWALDLNHGCEDWRLVPTAGTLETRWWGAAAYDPVGHRILHFGGTRGEGVGDERNDVVALSLAEGDEAFSTVIEGTPPDAGVATDLPLPRVGHQMVYDETRHRMIVIGGGAEVTTGQPFMLDDVWALDLTAGSESWSVVDAIDQGPGPRLGFGAVYDAVDDQLVVIGGCADVPDCNTRFDTVSIRPLAPGGTWSDVTLSGATIDGIVIGFVQHRWRDRFYAMIQIDKDFELLEIARGAPSWTVTKLFSTRDLPPERSRHVDAVSQDGIVILHGGQGALDGTGPSWALDDAWVFRFNDHTWEPATQSGTLPEPGLGYAFTRGPAELPSDSHALPVLVTGGRCESSPDAGLTPCTDTWRASEQGGAGNIFWERWAPPADGGPGPTPPFGAAAALERRSGGERQLDVFGGVDGAGDVLDERWLFDTLAGLQNAVWTSLLLPPANTADAAATHCGDATWVFGGLDATGQATDKLYRYVEGSWTDATGVAEWPGARSGHTLTCVANDRLFLLGGSGPGVTSYEAWVLDCSSVPCTAGDLTPPIGRVAPFQFRNHSATWEGQDEMIYLVGGRAGSGFGREVWTFGPAY
jgi:hypothetical protein